MALGLPTAPLGAGPGGEAGAREPVAPRPAATVVLLRPGPDGLEVLLTRRPSTMAFAPDLHVFPGGAVDAADAAPAAVARSVVDPATAVRLLGDDLPPPDAIGALVAALRELWEEAGVALIEGRHGPPAPEALASARSALLAGTSGIGSIAETLDVRLRTDLLVPLSRWVTPPIMERRFDVRFLVAALPPGAEPSFASGEIVDHRWLTPRAALDAMARGEIELWIPTSATLQQLEHVTSLDELRQLAPGPSSPIRLEEHGADVVRVVLPAAGGVGGQTVNGYAVGRRELVVVDPGDPSEAATDALLALADARAGRIVAVAITSAAPDHAAGAEALALQLDVPLFTGERGGHDLPAEVRELGDGDVLPAGDVRLVALATPGPRQDQTAWVAAEPGVVFAGDLVGLGPSRSLLPPPDHGAWRASLERVGRLAPRRVLPGHGEPAPDAVVALDTQRRRLPPG